MRSALAYALREESAGRVAARVLAATGLLALACTGSQPAANFHEIEAPGNLESTKAVGCVPLTSLDDTYTPADVYPGVRACIDLKHFPQAVDLFAMASTYARYDTLRVSDETAHQAGLALSTNALSDLDDASKRAFQVSMMKAQRDSRRWREICDEMRRIGPPAYYPRYMVQHGLDAVAGDSTSGGLVEGFDPADAWEKSLTGYLHCPPK